jgi:hypothetical protein
MAKPTWLGRNEMESKHEGRKDVSEVFLLSSSITLHSMV